MRYRVIWLTAVLLVGFLGVSPAFGQDGVENLLTNGGFESGVFGDPWGIYGSATAEVVEELIGADVPEGPLAGNYCLHVEVSAAGANIWDSGMTQRVGMFEDGKKYTFSAFLKCAEGTWRISFKPELPVDPYTAYGEQTFTVTDEWAEYSTTTPVFTEDVEPAGIAFHVAARAGEFWMDEVRFYEGDYVPPVFQKQLTAENPSPEDGATDVPQDVELSWEPGEFADTHDVYLGTVAQDVNDADPADPLGVLVSPGQTALTYAPENLLEFGETYYWRVDEVNALPDTTVYPGPVWSFTVEPYAYPITNISASASSSRTNMGPEKTIDESGLNDDDQHSTVATDMWLTAAGEPQPAWIQYEFDRPYVLQEMWVWNSNQDIEDIFGLGARDVTIEYSLDGAAWTTLDEFEFAQAPGLPSYVPDAPILFGGVEAQYVRLTINTNWGGGGVSGLSEVRFFYVPVAARAPEPAVGTSGVALDATLNWRPGRGAVEHELYFSSDRAAVEDGSALLATLTEHSYDLSLTDLNYGQRYYWKVNEIDANGVVVPGDIWRFSTIEYRVLDDFESYTNDSPDRVFQTWLDGLGYSEPQPVEGNGTGAIVGHDIWSDASPYLDGDIVETDNVHGGRQALPLYYDNSAAPYYSETERTWTPPEDWTANGITDLSLWFHGAPQGFVQTGPDSVTMSAAGADIYNQADEFRFAYKSLAGNGSIVARVDSLVNTNEWAKAGLMIRESLEPGARNAAICMTPSNGATFQRRPFSNGDSEDDTTAGVSIPQWIRITRTGNVFEGEYSADGTTWETVGTVEIALINNAYVGLCLTSHDADVATVAEFSGIATTGGVSGVWQVEEIGAEQPDNDLADLYVRIEDTAGGSATVTYPEGTVVNEWTEWKIALGDLTGVNLAAVEKLILGVGNAETPVEDGAGMVLYDDIRVGTEPVPGIATNLLTNGGFEDGVLDPWYLADNTGGGATMEVVQELTGATVSEDPAQGDSCLHLVVPTAGANFWDVYLTQGGYVFEAGKKYTLSAFCKCSSGTLDINFKPELAAAPWSGFGEQVITMTDEWAEYSVTTPVFTEDTSPASATFHMGFAPGDFWMDDIKLYEGDYVPTE